jgi:Zn-dependent membrane protease YugP
MQPRLRRRTLIFRLFDYLLLALPGFAIAIWARWRLSRAYSAGSKLPAASGRTGGEIASAILRANGVSEVVIVPAAGELSTHYDPSGKVLRLSHRVHDGRSMAALGVSAHEAGHALQDASKYPWLTVRNIVVPLASTGSQLFWLLILAGILLGIDRLILAGIVLYSAVLFFQLVNLPIEFDASRRGRAALATIENVESDVEPVVGEVLNAACWRYVASTLTGVVEPIAAFRNR